LKSIAFYNSVRLFYARLLHQWGLECEQSEIMKFVHKNTSNSHFGDSDQVCSELQLGIQVKYGPNQKLSVDMEDM
jgi:hypothetical protein